MALNAFRFAEEPPAPCDKFACAHRTICSEQDLACTSFLHYVLTGRVAHPHIHFPHGHKPQTLDSVEPTREIYEKAMRQW